MKIIIPCAGNSIRFNTDYPKHISNIDGVPNIKRTIDLLDDSRIMKIIVVTNKDNNIFFKNIELNAEIIIGSSDREIDRFRNIFNYISNGDIILYGDVVFHIDDLKIILNCDGKDNIYIGRRGPNHLTNKKWGEIFAIKINNKDKFIDDVRKTADLFERGIIKREIAWEVYKVSENLKRLKDRNNNKIKTVNFVDVSDKTDDFDFYEDYLILKKIYEKKDV